MLQYFCWAARNCKRAGARRKHRYKVEQRLPSIWPSRAISDIETDRQLELEMPSILNGVDKLMGKHV